MKEKVKQYVEVESALDRTLAELKQKKEEYEKTIEVLLALKAKQEEELAKLKVPIEEEAKKLFKETKEKSLYGGIGIKEYTTITYDPKKATDWALEKKMFLNLDAKAFEKAAPSLNLDWVKTGKEPKVTFPKEWRLED